MEGLVDFIKEMAERTDRFMKLDEMINNLVRFLFTTTLDVLTLLALLRLWKVLSAKSLSDKIHVFIMARMFRRALESDIRELSVS